MDFLRGLKACGLGGPKLVISGIHAGLWAAIECVFEATHGARVADQLRSHWSKLARLMDESERDALAYMAFNGQ